MQLPLGRNEVRKVSNRGTEMGILQKGIIHSIADWWRVRVLGIPPLGTGVFFRLRLDPRYRRRVRRP